MGKRGPAPVRVSAADRRLVREMSQYGTPEEGIARVLGMSASWVRKHFRKELDTAATQKNNKVAASLYRLAVPGKGKRANVVACIFWLKTRARWKEDRTPDLPQVPPEETDLSNLSAEELLQLKALQAKARKKPE